MGNRRRRGDSANVRARMKAIVLLRRGGCQRVLPAANKLLRIKTEAELVRYLAQQP